MEISNVLFENKLQLFISENKKDVNHKKDSMFYSIKKQFDSVGVLFSELYKATNKYFYSEVKINSEVKTNENLGHEPIELFKKIPGNSPIEYKNGENKHIAPTDKKILGKTEISEVYGFKNKEQLAIKKFNIRADEKNDLREYEIGNKLNHPNLVKLHNLYIKKCCKDDYVFYKIKIVMDKVKGTQLEKYIRYDNEKLSKEHAKALIKQARDCCTYLFDNGVVWGDVNAGNLFVEETGNLKIIDFGGWGIEENPIKRGMQLLLGSMEIVGWVVKGTVPLEGTRRELYQTKISECISPKEFFGKELKLKQVFSRFGYTENVEWMKDIMSKLQLLKYDEIQPFLEQYFDSVINKIDAML